MSRAEERGVGAMVSAAIEEGCLEISESDLARARTAYRGALDAGQAWRAFTANSRHHDVTYWSMLVSLFVEPGLNRMTLIERICGYAGVSRSTAERAIREARESGYIGDRPAGKEVHFYLSSRVFNHCVRYFRDFMDLHSMMRNFGYEK
jgi:hypothetical protein